METSASYEARLAPLPYPTTGMKQRRKNPYEKGLADLVGGLIVYSVVFAVVAVARLRSINSAKSDLHLDLAKKAVEALRRHWVGIRQATLAMFYVFGLVLFLVLQYVGVVVGDGGPGFGTRQFVASFTLSCAFATNVFFGFLVLHIVQWVISGRINSALEALDERKPQAGA